VAEEAKSFEEKRVNRFRRGSGPRCGTGRSAALAGETSSPEKKTQKKSRKNNILVPKCLFHLFFQFRELGQDLLLFEGAL